MFPILYEQIERNPLTQTAPRFVVPQHNGLGVLSDCSSCYVEQERNGIYELTMEYPANGIHAKDIAYRRIIKVKPNFTDNPQLFRIDRIGKTLNGKFTVYAKHISYDLSGYIITSGTAINTGDTCALLRSATNNDFYIHTTKNVVADFRISEPSSVKSWFAGKEGSFLDVYGMSEIKYDNFDVNFMLHAGVQEPRVSIRYGKNLLELSQEMDSSNLYTHVLCYYKASEGAAVSGTEQATGLQLDVLRSLAVDVSSEYENTPTIEELNERARKYIRDNNLTVPSNNITLNFAQSGELTGRVDLCDVVSVYYAALGINVEFECIRTKWDCLREKYVETEFGDAKKTLADTVTQNTIAADSAQSMASSVVNAANSKKRVFISEPIPPYDVGDLWVNDGGMYYCVTPRVESVVRELESDSELIFESAISEDFIEFECQIEPDEEGYGSVVVLVSNGETNPDTRVEKVYVMDLEETLTQGGTFKVFWGLNEQGQLIKKAMLIRTDTTEKEYDISTINIPETIVGHNVVSCNTGDIAIKYYETGFSHADWELATDYVNESVLETRITEASELITGTTGGNIVMHLNEQGMPYEFLILRKDSDPEVPVTIDNAEKVWRWNAGGLAYSTNGYDGPYDKIAITEDGKINASLITAGELNAIDAGLQNITASMFAGQMIQLGGSDMPNGKLIIKDGSDNILIQMDINGLECFGETVNDITPSVVFDKNGVTGYSNSADKENSAIFWTKEQDFHMKNAVIENQMGIGGMLKFLPFEIKNSSNVVTNQGIAVVADT